jgi:hypothetical protein
LELKKLRTPDATLNRIQDNIGDVLKALQNPILDGVRVTANLVTGDNSIPHKLGRKYQGYLVTGQTAAALIYAQAGASANSDKFLTLNASAPCSVVLWVF